MLLVFYQFLLAGNQLRQTFEIGGKYILQKIVAMEKGDIMAMPH